MLLLKMIKDLQQNIVQFMAIFVMSMLAIFVTSGLGVADMLSVNEYLQDSNYKDLDLIGLDFNNANISDIETFDKVLDVEGYYNTTGKMFLEDEVKMCFSFITGNDICKFYLKEGIPYSEDLPGVWIDYNISKSKNIKCGDILQLECDGSKFTEEVRGIIYSPQYLYYLVDSTFTEPDYSVYGFAVMGTNEYPGKCQYYDELLIDVAGVQGAVNKLGAEERRTLNQVRQRLNEYFGDNSLSVIYKDKDAQLKVYSDEVNSYKTLVTIFPMIFGLIAFLGIMTTMTRMVARQRTTIGALKALGFTSNKIIVHYMSYSLVIVLLGCILGAFLGFYILGDVIYGSLTYYYLNPYERYEISVWIYIYSAVILTGAALVSYISNSRILRLSASQILQPEAPKASKSSWYEQLKVWKKIKFATQWNIRDISRNTFRTLMSVAGVLICSSLIFASLGFFESLANQPYWQYDELIRAKNRIEFVTGTKYGTVYDYAREYKGQMLQIDDIKLIYNGVTENTSLMVLDKGNNKFVHKGNGEYYQLPDRGAAVTLKTAELLGIKTGDYVSFNFSGKKDVYEVQIKEITREPITQGIMLSRKAFENLNAVFEPNYIYTNRTVDEAIESRDEIMSVNSIEALKAGMINVAENNYYIVGIIIAVAFILGIAILYNLGSMSYSEKIKDMATLKVLGFQSKDLKLILLQQNLWITSIGAVLGIGFGYNIIELLTSMFGESVDFLVRPSMMPYAMDIGVTFVLCIVINMTIVSKIDNINMVEALKGI